MKQFFFLLCLISFSGLNFAQQQSEFYAMPWQIWSDFHAGSYSYYDVPERESIKNNRVKSREKIRYSKGLPLVTREFFDKNGRLTAIETEQKNGEKSSVNYTYSASGKILEEVWKNPKGQITKTTTNYDAEDRLLLQEKMDPKKGYSASEMQYNDEGQILFRRIYEKTKDSPVKELTYTYYENGDMKTTNYYKKGKLIYSWKFDCKPEGELINVKRKDETMLCISEDFDADGNRVVWERKFDEKGKLSKIKTVYAVDSLVVLKEIYSGTDKLIYEVHHFYNADRKPTRKTTNRFLKDGTPYRSDETIYSQENETVTTEYFDKKGNLQRTTHYAYDDRKIVKSQRMGGKWRYTHLYHYTDADLKKSEVRIYKSNTYVNEYVYDYYTD